MDGLKFITSGGMEYFVLVREEQERFFIDMPELAGFIYSVAFFPLNEHESGLLPLDNRIAGTIALIVTRLLSDRQNVVVFIADHSDNRHEARYRKFRAWYTRFAAPDKEVFINPIPIRGKEVMSCVIISAHHPLKEKVVYNFIRLAQRLAK